MIDIFSLIIGLAVGWIFAITAMLFDRHFMIGLFYRFREKDKSGVVEKK